MTLQSYVPLREARISSGPGTIASMKFQKVSSGLPNRCTLLSSAESAWSLQPCAPWISDLLRDLGQLALILFVSLERTVLIYRAVKPAPGSPGSNKQFPCLWQPFPSPLDTRLPFGSAGSYRCTRAGHHQQPPVESVFRTTTFPPSNKATSNTCLSGARNSTGTWHTAGSKPQSHADDREADKSLRLMEATVANKSKIGAGRWQRGAATLCWQVGWGCRLMEAQKRTAVGLGE